MGFTLTNVPPLWKKVGTFILRENKRCWWRCCNQALSTACMNNNSENNHNAEKILKIIAILE